MRCVIVIINHYQTTVKYVIHELLIEIIVFRYRLYVSREFFVLSNIENNRLFKILKRSCWIRKRLYYKRIVVIVCFFSIFLFSNMYYRCNQCFRVIRDSNLEKHFKKCKGTSFNCCDCNEEFSMETYQNHTNCPNAIKTLLPPVYNPKSVKTGNFIIICRNLSLHLLI